MKRLGDQNPGPGPGKREEHTLTTWDRGSLIGLMITKIEKEAWKKSRGLVGI